MPFDSEEKRSDFNKWAEEMSYEEEKEIKIEEKLQLKEQKKAERLAKKKNKGNDSSEKEMNEDEKEETTVSLEKEDASNNVSNDASESDSENIDNEKDSDFDESILISEKEKVERKPEEVNIVKELFSLVIYIGVVILICYLIITFVGQRTTVNGHSMENTLQDGDNLWIDKFTYHFKDPKRFDIIVFPYQDEDVYYIKRIIGLPGETVQIAPDGSILIDGKILAESYGKEVIFDSGTASEPRTLGEDEYFVLGDNRNDSRDSRWADVGNIDKDNIVGRAVFRLTPFKNMGKLD